MSESCIPIEDLARVAELPTDDPVRQHLAGCPRCRAQVAAFNDFLTPEPLANNAEARDADAFLTSALNREIFGSDSPEINPALADQSGSESALRRFMSRLTRPRLRPAWAFAAGLLVIVIMRGALFQEPTYPAPRVLRGDGDRPAAELNITASRELDGDLLFSWAALPGSDGCEIVFYASDLSECGRLDGGQGTELHLVDASRTLAAGETATFWRVIFHYQGDVIGQSTLTSLPSVD